MTELRRALAIYRALGCRRGEALALRSIGLVYRASGDLAAAEEVCAAAVGILRGSGDRLMEAYAVQALAKVRFRRRSGGREVPALLKCLRVCHELGDDFGEALLLRTLGELYLSERALDRAAACLDQALARWTRLKVPVFRARTLRDQALLHEMRGDQLTARTLLEEALETFKLHGTRELHELGSGLVPAPASDRGGRRPAAFACPTDLHSDG